MNLTLRDSKSLIGLLDPRIPLVLVLPPEADCVEKLVAATGHTIELIYDSEVQHTRVWVLYDADRREIERNGFRANLIREYGFAEPISMQEYLLKEFE